MAKKIFNTIRTAILCGYTYWKNPENFTNEGFAFTGQIMDAINKTAQDNPFDRITNLLSRRDEIILLYEAEKERLRKKIKPYAQNQEYSKMKEDNDRLNLVKEFILHLKRIK